VVAASGSHHDLLRDQPGYRALVSRGTDDDEHDADAGGADGDSGSGGKRGGVATEERTR
jgi:hypothetical protein